jgi:hypothetical protein
VDAYLERIKQLEERLQAAEAGRDRMSDSATVIIRRAEKAEAERDEARQEAEWQQKRAIAAENRNDDLRLSCQEQSRAKCAAIERAEMAEAARQQARREAFEEAAKIRTEMLKLDHVKARRNPGGWIEDYINLAIVVDRALAEVER